MITKNIYRRPFIEDGIQVENIVFCGCENAHQKFVQEFLSLNVVP